MQTIPSETVGAMDGLQDMGKGLEPLRTLSTLAVLIADLASKATSGHPGYEARSLDEMSSVEVIFELGCEYDLGSDAKTSDAEALIGLLHAHSLVLIIDLVSATSEWITASQSLNRGEANMVGVAILPQNGEWIFWRPVSYPLGGAKILFLPKTVSSWCASSNSKQ